MRPLKILIVDDDPGIRELIQLYLHEQGISSESVEDAITMDAWLSENQADIIILDLMLPGEDGLSIARRLRAQSSIGILMLSARSEEIDRIIGLEIGADDYLSKPFNPRELLARIRALSRRQNQMHNENSDAPLSIYDFDPFSMDFKTHTLKKNDQLISLTHSEYDLLKILVTHPNQVLSRDTLMTELQGYEHTPYDRSIDVCISRIRRKMGDNSGNKLFIETIRGVGYRFNVSDNE